MLASRPVLRSWDCSRSWSWSWYWWSWSWTD